LLDQKEAKLKTKRCFCALAFTLARRLVGPGLFLSFPSYLGGVPEGRGGKFICL
jgi:hypothetical protein